MNERVKEKIIHIAKYHPPKTSSRYLFLKQNEKNRYAWYEENGSEQIETTLQATSIEEALRLAHKTWKYFSFRTIICGFRFTLPERDEHGINALFFEMVASFNSPNGVYFDLELGHPCIVQNASTEALGILHRLKESNQL